jgi:hypothetical protein
MAGVVSREKKGSGRYIDNATSLVAGSSNGRQSAFDTPNIPDLAHRLEAPFCLDACQRHSILSEIY